MQASARQQELERLYNARKGHVPHISISDDSHHVTEAIGSYYEEDDGSGGAGGGLGAPGSGGGGGGGGSPLRETRPLSFMPGDEVYDARARRRGTYLESTPAGISPVLAQMRANPPPLPQVSTTTVPASHTSHDGENHSVTSPKSPRSPSSPTTNAALHRMGSLGGGGANSPAPQPPPLNRQSSAETAVQQFPLNDIDYESSAAAVAQELSNLQAIRRMSMNVDTADPDLPSFGGSYSGGSAPSSPSSQDDDHDPSKLFWVPARLHPELAPKEFKTFIEDRVDKIRRRSGGEDSLSPDGLDRSGSSSSLQRKKSMLSHQIDTRDHYEDGAERLMRKRSKGIRVEGHTTVESLSELEALVKDPSQLIRRMSLDVTRRSQDSGVEVDPADDAPILPAGGTLKRSTRTTYRKGSVKKGERGERFFSKRAQHRHTGSDTEEAPPPPPPQVPTLPDTEPILGLTRVQTEPSPPRAEPLDNFSRPGRRRNNAPPPPVEPVPEPEPELEPQSSWDEPDEQSYDHHDAEPEPELEPAPAPPQPQPRPFQSRIASQGRTTAQLPGYNNPNPLPHVIDTLPDGSKVPSQGLLQNIPERKSSHEIPRQFQRSASNSSRPGAGRNSTASSTTFDDISQSPTPLPGSGNSRTDVLTMIPTLEEKKSEKKEGSKKSGWKWILGNDDDDKKSKEESSKAKSKLTKASADKARLDVLQSSIDGNPPASGRESIVLDRSEIHIEEEPRKSSKKSGGKDGQPGLLAALFGGGKKKFADGNGEPKEKKRKADRHGRSGGGDRDRDHSPDLAPRLLKPDIDYNWTRFSILEERAIYRMAHFKLANPRRALYSQVLLSNFMYSYLAKVQMMHPQIQIPAAQRAAQQRNQPKTDEAQQQAQQQQQQQQQDRPAEYSQYQLWQEVSEGPFSTRLVRSKLTVFFSSQQQARQDTASERASTSSSSGRRSTDQPHDSGGHDADHASASSAGYERHSSEDYNRQYEQQQQQQQQPGSAYGHHSGSSAPRGHHSGGDGGHGGGGGGAGADQGYSVASTHDYLGYRHDEKPFGDKGLWEDEEKAEELW